VTNPTPTQSAPGTGVAITGIILGLFIPLVGIILGIVALVKRNYVLGSVALIVSVIAWLIWTTVFLS